MKLFKRVAIIGVGLIGGSLGMVLKKKKLAVEVIGVSRHARTIADARRKGAIDRGSRSLEIIRGADCVILAAPVSIILKQAAQIARLVDKDCVVSDVGSSKGLIVNRLERLFPFFVGTHPLAGSQKRGIIHAYAELFGGSLCILTPTGRTDRDALKKITSLWHDVGAKTIRMSPARHDRIVSGVSHLPHAVAYSLMNSIPAGLSSFAAGGLKDTTRIAGSDENIWCDIFLSNKKALLKSLGDFKTNLRAFESALRRNDRAAITAFLKKAKQSRERLERDL